MAESTLITERFCVPNTSEGCGHGLCNAQGTYCSCFPGYVEDFTQMMFPNCYLYRDGEIAFLVVIAVLCFAIMCAGVYMLPGSKGLPRTLIQCVIASSILEIGHLIALGAEGRPGIPATIFLMGVHVIGGCLAVFVLLWSFVSPTLDLMMMHAKQRLVRQRMMLLTALFTLEQISVFTPALVFQYRGNYKVFNIIVAAQLTFIACYTLMWAAAVKYYSSILFVKMDQLINSIENSSDSIIGKHRKRLGVVVTMTIPLCLFAGLVCALLAGLYFGLGVHPYRFVIYIVYSLLFPFFNVILLILARKRQMTSTSSDNNNSKRSSKRIDQQGGLNLSNNSKNEDISSTKNHTGYASTAQSDAVVVPQL